jgi:hypothetical protein
VQKGAIRNLCYAQACGNDNVFFLPAPVLNQNRTLQNKIPMFNIRLPALPGKVGFQILGKEGGA